MTTSDPELPDETAAAAEDEELPWPVGFIVIVGLAVLYLGWRVIQLIGRGIDWLF